MKKIKNDDLRTVGIVLSLISIALIVQPIVRMLMGLSSHAYFFTLLHGWLAILPWFIFLSIGIYLILKTEKLSNEEAKRAERQAKKRKK